MNCGILMKSQFHEFEDNQGQYFLSIIILKKRLN